MAGMKAGTDAWSVVVSVLVAAALATIAVVTVERAGCADPGHYVLAAGGYELVGGCLESGDLQLSPVTPQAPTESPADPRSPLRP
ncbi:MAG: hypothetical protein ACR2G2_10045 [Pseudonocardia sp.]